LVLDLLADVVVVVHLAFIIFVAVGAVIAWRWRLLVWLHVPALAYGVGIVTIGWTCPLTPLEKWLRPRKDYEGGFVDHYLEDVVWPEELTPLLWGGTLVLVVVGYAGVLVRVRRSAGAAGLARR
jgi:hypothetical protein